MAYILIICSMPLLMTQIPVVLDALPYLFHDRHCVLCHKIADELDASNYESAQKSIRSLAKWEEKQRKRVCLSYPYVRRSAEYYQALLSEAQNDYRTALDLRLKYNDKIKAYYGKRGYVDYYAKPRLLFKLNMKSNSFKEYCIVTNEVKQLPLCNFNYYSTGKFERLQRSYELSQDNGDSEAFRIICRNICDQLTYNPPINNNPQRYVSFPEFLKFAEEEYAKLGEPEEYADAMIVFRTINATLYEQVATPENAETPGQAEPQ